MLRLDYVKNETDADDLLAVVDAVQQEPGQVAPGAALYAPVSPAETREPRAPLTPPAGGPGITRRHLRLIREHPSATS